MSLGVAMSQPKLDGVAPLMTDPPLLTPQQNPCICRISLDIVINIEPNI